MKETINVGTTYHNDGSATKWIRENGIYFALPITTLKSIEYYRRLSGTLTETQKKELSEVIKKIEEDVEKIIR